MNGCIVLFWDFDGTLAYSDHLWSRAMCEAVNEAAGQPLVVLDDVRPHMRTGFPWHTPERPYPGQTGMAWWTMLYRRLREIGRALGLPPEQAEAVGPRLRTRILEPSRYHLYPDTRPVLDWTVRHGYRNVLLSNNYPELPDMLERLGLAHYFEGMVVSALEGYEKPHPVLYARALALAGTEASACVMIGDNPAADIEGGRRAGMRTILVHREVPDSGAEAILPALEALPAWLTARVGKESGKTVPGN